LSLFLPIEQLFTLGSYFIIELALIFGPLFSAVQAMYVHINFNQKMCWATFLAIFSQTHLVTLMKADLFSVQTLLLRVLPPH
jgi:hypothetical protein